VFGLNGVMKLGLEGLVALFRVPWKLEKFLVEYYAGRDFASADRKRIEEKVDIHAGNTETRMGRIETSIDGIAEDVREIRKDTRKG
jgi:hypothetical protein